MDVESSSGNVFADIGLDEPWERLAKARLAAEITGVMQARSLSQTEAAALMGVSQPKVSDIVRGHLTGYTFDRLFHCVRALGCEVEIAVQPRPAG